MFWCGSLIFPNYEIINSHMGLWMFVHMATEWLEELIIGYQNMMIDGEINNISIGTLKWSSRCNKPAEAVELSGIFITSHITFPPSYYNNHIIFSLFSHQINYNVNRKRCNVYPCPCAPIPCTFLNTILSNQIDPTFSNTLLSLFSNSIAK